MLAPRKTLWSTPLEVVDICFQKIPLQDNDCVCDIGCGDGRVLIRWAELLSSSSISSSTSSSSKGTTMSTTRTPPRNNNVSFVGIDIDPDRIKESREAATRAKQEGRILPHIDIQFFCDNALECCTTTSSSSTIFQRVTVFFLYLIPRGLKQVYPILTDHRKRMGTRPVRVVTYMSKLPSTEIKPLDSAVCHVPHQKEAAWPIYFYEL